MDPTEAEFSDDALLQSAAGVSSYKPTKASGSVVPGANISMCCLFCMRRLHLPDPVAIKKTVKKSRWHLGESADYPG